MKQVLPVHVVKLILLAAVSFGSLSALAQVQYLVKPASDLRIERKPEKYGFLKPAYWASQSFLLVATVRDSKSTVDVLNHPPVMSYATAGGVARATPYYGVETGWARFLGKRNTGGIVAANVLANAGVSYASYRMYRRGGWKWKTAAIALTTARAVIVWRSAGHNNDILRRMNQMSMAPGH